MSRMLNNRYIMLILIFLCFDDCDPLNNVYLLGHRRGDSPQKYTFLVWGDGANIQQQGQLVLESSPKSPARAFPRKCLDKPE